MQARSKQHCSARLHRRFCHRHLLSHTGNHRYLACGYIHRVASGLPPTSGRFRVVSRVQQPLIDDLSLSDLATSRPLEVASGKERSHVKVQAHIHQDWKSCTVDEIDPLLFKMLSSQGRSMDNLPADFYAGLLGGKVTFGSLLS